MNRGRVAGVPRGLLSALIGWVLVGAGNAAGATLYVTDGEVGLYTLDPSTGGSTFVGSFGPERGDGVLAGLAYDAVHGRLYATATRTDKLFEVEPATGHATVIGPLTGATLLHGLAYDNVNGALYGTYGGGDSGHISNLYRIDPASGTATWSGR